MQAKKQPLTVAALIAQLQELPQGAYVLAFDSQHDFHIRLGGSYEVVPATSDAWMLDALTRDAKDRNIDFNPDNYVVVL